MKTIQTLYRFVVRDKGKEQGLAASMMIDFDVDLEYTLYEVGEKLPLPNLDFSEQDKFYFTSLGLTECDYLIKLWAFNILLQKREGLFSEELQIVKITVTVNNDVPRVYADDLQQVIDENHVIILKEELLDLEAIWNEVDDEGEYSELFEF